MLENESGVTSNYFGNVSSNSSCQLNQTWIINDAKSTWVAFTRKKMRLEKNLIDCFANGFEKLFKTIANKETCNLFLISPTIVFLPPSLRGHA